MSRVGKKPIPIPDKCGIEVNGQTVTVKGPKGELSIDAPGGITVVVENNEVVVTRASELKQQRAFHGLTRALVANMVEGTTKGFRRELQIVGVGYRAEMRGRLLILHLGFSHPIVLDPPEGVDIEVIPKENRIIITGIDKQMVGQCAAKIRSFRKPEPYKGKGVRYVGEHVRSKAGKAAVGSGA